MEQQNNVSRETIDWTNKFYEKTIQFKAITNDNTGVVEGQAIVKNSVDQVGDSFADDCEFIFAEKYSFHREHEYDNIYAANWNNTMELSVNDQGVWVKVTLDKDEELYKKIKSGLVWGLSSGFQVLDYDFVTIGDPEEANYSLVFKKVLIHEVSATYTPCETETYIKSMKNYKRFMQQEEVSHETIDKSIVSKQLENVSHETKAKNVSHETKDDYSIIIDAIIGS